MKKTAYLGVVLLLIGLIGYAYTYTADHRTAASLSAYCDIDFQGSRDEQGQVEGATLTLVDYRYSDARLKPLVSLAVDGEEREVDAVTRQTSPTYTWKDYQERTSFHNTNKLFLEVPFDLLAKIRSADEVRVRFAYTDGLKIDLPLNAPDLEYWKKQLQEK